ncbi:MAG TPA: M20/M25/M40 family metallo-hydrolase, partial [Burkholderiales bacterium]|nr:M20/M25/M40 family metallo-hydrolase [Burkholderiales bacterium]
TAMADCARRANVDMRIVEEWTWNAELFDPECIALVRDTARRLGVASLDLPSQAGHDAYHVARVAPTAMMFSPCKDGITHNNKEHADLERTAPAVNVLANVVLQRANR